MKIPQSLSHAYLISGGREESRIAYARQLASAYLCEGETVPCGRCRPCRKVASGIHPDLTWVNLAEGKKEITVDQARSVRTDVYIRPNEGKRKVYIISPADSMNDSAQNALLKVLEEGPSYGAFLLLAHEPGRLLETIRSRCEGLTLPPEEDEPNPEQLERAEKLAELLMGGSELAVAEYFTAMEQEKWKSGELAELLLLTERCVSPYLKTNSRRAVAVLKALKACRDNQIYNPGAGHTLGWLSAELFR